MSLPGGRLSVPLLAVLLAGCTGEPQGPRDDGLTGEVARGSSPAAAAPAPETQAQAQQQAQAPEIAAPGARSLVLACEGRAPFAVRPLEANLQLELPLETRVLRRAVAASGERYADATTEVWLKGDGALLRDEAGGVQRSCRVREAMDPWMQAALRDVTFRAIGQEPGWLVEVVPARWIRVLADYGQVQHLFPPSAPVASGEAERYEATLGEHRFSMVVVRRACEDGMSGERSPFTVEIVLDGESFRGCGRDLP